MEAQARTEWFIEQKALNPDKWARKMTCRQSTIDKVADEHMKHDLNDCITKETFVLEQYRWARRSLMLKPNGTR